MSENIYEGEKTYIPIWMALIAMLLFLPSLMDNLKNYYDQPIQKSTVGTESTVETEIDYEFVGEFGVIEDGISFPYARMPAEPAWEGTLRITHYGEPRFPITNDTARWPMTVAEGIEWAEELNLDGICAVAINTRWYYRVRDEMPPILEIEGFGKYLAIDRVGHGTDIDIYIQDSSVYLFADPFRVREIERTNEHEIRLGINQGDATPISDPQG